jgi:flagellar basal-body rod protein FlgB
MVKIDTAIDSLQAGIKAEFIRQKTIAANVSNIETPGYRASDVKFEDLLAKALKSKSGADIADIEPEIFQPNQTAVKPNGNDVSFEAEVGRMVENTLKHKTYVRLFNKKIQQMEQAIQTP